MSRRLGRVLLQGLQRQCSVTAPSTQAATCFLPLAGNVLPETSTSAHCNQVHAHQQVRHAAHASQYLGCRSFSTDDQCARARHSPLSEEGFHHLADETLDTLCEALEQFVEDCDIDDSDVQYSQGVLTVKLGKHGTYVINKQTPNRQIWLSSPVSGPFRYDVSNGRWVYSRDGRDLLHQLEQELQQLLGRPLQLG